MADLTSDITTPSSPQRVNNASISSPPPRCSSPPSSPPGFPWEEASAIEPSLKSPPKPSVTTAFSILGKRSREPLSTTTANPRPTKKLTISEHGAKLTQLQINLGQRTRRKCPVCGMEFVPSCSEDTKLHDRYHLQKVAGIAVPKTFVEATPTAKKFSGARPEDVIVRIDWEDATRRRQMAQKALELVQRELGAVSLNEEEVWDKEGGFKAYLHVRGGRCVGFLLTESVEEAFTVADKKKAPDEKEGLGVDKDKTRGKTAKKMSALEALEAKRSAALRASVELEKKPVEVSKSKVEVKLGISRIWTLEACRGQGIAEALLDTAFADEKLKSKKDVAFSQPTQAGAKLARKWTGMVYGWRVYA